MQFAWIHKKTGMVLLEHGDLLPDDYTLANGRAVRRDEYPELFALWGTKYGPGDRKRTFNLPRIMQG